MEVLETVQQGEAILAAGATVRLEIARIAGAEMAALQARGTSIVLYDKAEGQLRGAIGLVLHRGCELCSPIGRLKQRYVGLSVALDVYEPDRAERFSKFLCSCIWDFEGYCRYRIGGRVADCLLRYHGISSCSPHIVRQNLQG